MNSYFCDLQSWGAVAMEEYIKKGENLFEQGKIEEAESLFLSLLSEKPYHPEVLNNLGVLCHSQGRSEEAESYFKRSLEASPDYQDALLNLNSLLQESGHCEQTATFAAGSRPEISAIAHANPQKVLLCCLPGLDNFVDELIQALTPEIEITKLVSNRMEDFLAAMGHHDVVWLEWGNQLAEALTKHASNALRGKRVICRIHSYEVIDGLADRINFSTINDLIFVAPHIEEILFNRHPEIKQQVDRVHVIPNGVNLERFKFIDRPRGFNLAYLGITNHKKGPMLLLHALWQLVQADKRYVLHLGGTFQDMRYQLYFEQMIKAMDLAGNVQLDGWIRDVPTWLQDKHFIVCTSVLEGHPVALMEAMATGLKPLIHNYVGAKGVFPDEYIWTTIPEFVQQVMSGPFHPIEYRNFIAQHYSLERQAAGIRSLFADLKAGSEQHAKKRVGNPGSGEVSMPLEKNPHAVSSTLSAGERNANPGNNGKRLTPETLQKGASRSLDLSPRPPGMPPLHPDADQDLMWVNRNTIRGESIIVSSRRRLPYPEVTGYFIPTLLAADQHELAMKFAAWLPSVQNADGSFSGPKGGPNFAFDTGQVVRGLVAAVDDLPELEEPLRRACNWLIDSSTGGRLPLPSDMNAWSMGKRGFISEGVHLYVLPALAQAGEKLNEPKYDRFVSQSLDFYLRNVELTDFGQPNMLTHLYAYIQEALFDLGAVDECRKGMASLARHQWPNGGLPAYSDVSWVCSPGLAQAAIVWLKLNETDPALRALSFLKMIRNPSGGFFGSYGIGAEYFADEEISWAVKFHLDALLLEGIPHEVQPAPEARNANMGPNAWHQAIVGGRTPEIIAQGLRRGERPSWAGTILEQTRADEQILELGSGTGELSAALALTGRRVALLDFSPESIEFSRRLFQYLNLPGEFRQGNVLEALPFPDKSFDCVFSSGLLEHFDPHEQEKILEEAARVCRGQVITLVPNGASLAYRLGKWHQEEKGTWKWGKEEPLFSLRPSYEKAGLRDIKEFSVDPHHALNFLRETETKPVAEILEQYYRSLKEDHLSSLNQGYLLVTIGKITSKDLRGRMLAVVPNDPLSAYQSAGYPDLTDYFNPEGYFDEVYCLSPQEKEQREIYGLHVIPTSAQEFATRIKEFGINIIRAYDLRAGAFAAASKPPNIPLVVSVHDVNPRRVPGELPKADRYIAISQAVEEFLLDRGAPAPLIARLPNRVDMDIFRPIDDLKKREEFRNRFPGRYLILCVGRLVEQKNQDTLIRALAVLGADYTIILVGQGDPEPYQALARSLGVKGQVHFVPTVPNQELATYYSFCDCMCTPSRWEGFGIVFIEALACGAVVVTSNLAPMNEYIRHEENGILVDQWEDPAALAAAIRQACTDEKIRGRIGVKARCSVERYSKAIVSKAEQALYSQMIPEGLRKDVARAPGTVAEPKTEIHRWCPELKDEWNRLTEESGDAWLYHTYEWQELLAKAWKANVLSIAIMRGGRIAGIFPLMLMPSGKMMDSAFGPAGPAFAGFLEKAERSALFKRALEEIRKLMELNSVKLFRVSLPPLMKSSEINFRELLLPAGFQDVSTFTYLLDLHRSEEELWSKLTKTMRYDISRARKLGFEISPANSLEDMKSYYDLHQQTYRRTGVKPHPYEYFEAIWNQFGKRGLARFFLARIEGRVVAADNIAVFKNKALYWTNASADDYLKTGVNKLLQWEAITWARQAGLETYEVGEGFPTAKRGSKLAGLNFFKRSFGGQIFNFYKGQFKYEPQ